MSVLTEAFLERLETDLVETGVYLYLHPNEDAVIREAVKTLSIVQVSRLALVVPSIGTAAVRACVEALRERIAIEDDSLVVNEFRALAKMLVSANGETLKQQVA